MLGHNVAVFLASNLHKKYPAVEWATMCRLEINWQTWDVATTVGQDTYVSLCDFLVQYGLYCLARK